MKYGQTDYWCIYGVEIGLKWSQFLLGFSVSSKQGFCINIGPIWITRDAITRGNKKPLNDVQSEK